MSQNETMFTDDIVCPHCGRNEPQSIKHFTAGCANGETELQILREQDDCN